ncbi:general substrate transporter [Crepidotus variabilis]|uniref:General substrate transporter n=1 Tax=Crepidotus variabilis TaxID=179855 RepID=A0A9P6E6U6_9AGAR|nr:general substrate transporter [Crepidotus variabilis]
MRPHGGGYQPLTPITRNTADTSLSEEVVHVPERETSFLNAFNGARTLNINGGTLTIQPDGRSYSYAYGPKGLAGLRYNRYALMCAFFASIGGLEFGYDQGVIANVLVMKDFIHRWPISPLQKGMMTAVLELGALLGTIATGVYTDRFSRQNSIVAACEVVFCVGSAFQAFAQNLGHLFIGRAVGGLGVGALSMLAPLYMAEISPPEVRGSLMALEQFSIVLGVVFGFWIGFMTRDLEGSSSWRIPLGLQLIPGIVLAVGCYFLPPSPRLLVLQGKHEDALVSLAKLRLRTPEEAAGDPLLQIELTEMRVETALIKQALTLEAHTQSHMSQLAVEWQAWRKLWSHKLRDRTWIGVLIMFFQQWSGINALLYYGPTLVHSIGMRGDTVTLLVSGGIGITQLLAVLPAIVWIDKVGRRPLLRGGSVAMSLSHLSIAILVILFQSDWPAHPFAAWLAVAGIYSFTFAYGVSFGPIGWVLPSEVFPLSLRSKGVALSTASNWVNNFFIGLLTPVVMDFSAWMTFLIFATACVCAYIWSTYYVPETANVSLEEIDKLFRSSAGQEEATLKTEIEEELGLKDLIRELADER